MGDMYQASHEVQDMAAKGHGSHILPGPNERASLPKPCNIIRLLLALEEMNQKSSIHDKPSRKRHDRELLTDLTKDESRSFHL